MKEAVLHKGTAFLLKYCTEVNPMCQQTPDRSARILCDEDGAITVDWIVLTAAAMLGCFSVTLVLSDGSRDIGTNVAENLELIGEHMVEDATSSLSD